MAEALKTATASAELPASAPSPRASADDVSSALSFLGLSDLEIIVYRTALELGSRPAGIIAQKAGLKRGQTYNILAQLTSKGIIQEFIKNNVRHFTCSAPTSLLSVLESRAEELEVQRERLQRVIPFLDTLRNPLAAPPKVRFFQGSEAVKEIYEDMLREEKPIYALVDQTFSWSIRDGNIPDFIRNFLARREKKNIWYYGIVNKSPEMDETVRARPAKKRRLRMIRGVPLTVEIKIYGPKVAIISVHDETVGLIIESHPVAETLRNLHKAAWQFLPPYR